MHAITKQYVLAILTVFGLVSCGLALADTNPTPTELEKSCYSAAGPALKSANGKLTADVRQAYLQWAETTVLDELHSKNSAVPESCLAAVHRETALRAAIFGSVYPPDPSILQNYANLSEQLGAPFLAKYKSFVIAIAVARRTKGVESAAQIKEIGQDYQAGFWTDESLHQPGSDDEKRFVRLAADFMNESKAAAADLYQISALQVQFKVYLANHGISANWIAEVHKSVSFGERLKDAMVLLNQRPGAREPKPGAVAWMRHLVEINEAIPASTPDDHGKPMPWPLFPLTPAPWPLLMPLAHSVPLSEADYIWETFQGEHGPDRYHTYGPYYGDDDVISHSLMPSKWFWDAWPDRIVHGGMCVPISKGTVDLYSSLGKPAMWAGQPGHANLITFQRVGGVWTAEIEQAFAGGPDVTSAQWYFDEGPNEDIHFRSLYDWPGAEYHLGLALAMRVGLPSYMDTRIAANLFRALPPDVQASLGTNLLRSALQINPFNPELWYRLASHSSDMRLNLALVRAASDGKPGLIADPPGATDPIMHGDGPVADQYWSTIGRFIPRYALFGRPTPRKIEEMRDVYNAIKVAPGVNARELADYIEQFAAYPADPAADNARYDIDLASKGDALGQLRLALRYRDGDGVAQNDSRAQELLTKAARQGDAAASVILGSMYPAIPPDMISVTASSVFTQQQSPRHLVDGTGMEGAGHDNEGGASSMWHTVGNPGLSSPGRTLPQSPAWVRFEFASPIAFDYIQIWNHNQAKLVDRGFRKTRIYGTEDGSAWFPLTAMREIELPRATGEPMSLPVSIPNEQAKRPLKAVVVEADSVNGNFGADCYGLSAVHFAVHRLSRTVPAESITLTASSVYSQQQDPQHLIDGSGMVGLLHDNADAAQTMWHTPDRPAAAPPAPGVAPSPAWVRFDFKQPQQVDQILIWNLNQAKLTDRGFRRTHIYATSDGTHWHSITGAGPIELPRASGSPASEPTSIAVGLNELVFKSVIIAADADGGNYGSVCYGLSAVRFVVHH